MKLISHFETSFGSMQERRILLIELLTDELIGWGELTAAKPLFYNSETTDTAWLMLRKYLAPCLLGQNFTRPDELTAKMEFVRDHEMSKAMLETAAWGVVARAKDISLASLLGATQTKIASGVSLDIHADIDPLLTRTESARSDVVQEQKPTMAMIVSRSSNPAWVLSSSLLRAHLQSSDYDKP